jgi:hypothetical protein
MKYPLMDCFARLERASEHIEHLDAEVDAFLDRYPYAFVQKAEADGWQSLHAVVEDSPPRISTIFGDVVHNLRSALDQLIWQLVIADGGKPTTANAFPIFLDEKAFFARVDSGKPERSPLRGIDPDGAIRAFIQRSQPFNKPSPRDEPLNIVNHLANRDKHRVSYVLRPFAHPPLMNQVVVTPPGAEIIDREAMHLPGPLEHDAPFLRLRFADTVMDPKMTVQGDWRLVTSFVESKRSSRETLALPIWLLRRVRRHLISLVQEAEILFFMNNIQR